MDETTARRIARNQAFFREVNETIEGVAETLSLKQHPAHYVCECGDARCSETIPLPLQAYEHVRAQPARFAVLYATRFPTSRSS